MKQFTALLIALSALYGCVDDSTGDPAAAGSDFDYDTLFADVADQVIIPNYQALATTAANFAADNGALATYCDDLLDSSEDSNALQASWLALMEAIQRSEAHLVGPAMADNQALRNRLNAYHLGPLSSCGIDQSVVQANQDPNFSIAAKTANQRGIGAMEYLLFNQDLTHTCPSQVTETANWNTLPELDRRQQRCDYAQLLADDIADAAATLLSSWEASQGNYRFTFTNPDNLEANLDALIDALFYVEIDLKDGKLGVPTGLNQACPALACPERSESPYSKTSLTHMRANLEGFQQVYSGGDGLGFDDFIRDQGMAELADSYITLSQDAIDHISGISVPLVEQAQAIVDSNDASDCVNAAASPETPSAASACALHGLMKRLTDSLRTEFIMVVDVELPDRGQSDND